MRRRNRNQRSSRLMKGANPPNSATFSAGTFSSAIKPITYRTPESRAATRILPTSVFHDPQPATALRRVGALEQRFIRLELRKQFSPPCLDRALSRDVSRNVMKHTVPSGSTATQGVGRSPVISQRWSARNAPPVGRVPERQR